MLDNPLWASLTTQHRDLAIGTGDVRRYPADVAPFLAVAHAGAPVPAGLVAPGETIYTVGPRPAGDVEHLGEILQMVCEVPPAVPDGPPIVSLDDHRTEVLALAAAVYPHYFRPRTVELGRYLGCFVDGRLAAMAGERMGMPGYRELSAVCTDPAFVGRGLARRLLAHLCTDLAARGITPFLHVSPSNTRAIRLYGQNGFVTRTAIAFGAVHA